MLGIETPDEAHLRHVEELKKEVIGWGFELNRGVNRGDLGYILYCCTLIKIYADKIKEMSDN